MNEVYSVQGVTSFPKKNDSSLVHTFKMFFFLSRSRACTVSKQTLDLAISAVIAGSRAAH